MAERIREFTVLEPPTGKEVRLRWLAATQTALGASETESTSVRPVMELGLVGNQQVPKPDLAHPEVIRFVVAQTLAPENGTITLMGPCLAEGSNTPEALADRITVRIPADSMAPATASMATR